MTSATDGDDALTKLKAEMPRLNGVELVQGIREQGITGKIVVLSSHLSPEIRDAYERAGVQVIMDKPFDVGKLRSAVEGTAA